MNKPILLLLIILIAIPSAYLSAQKPCSAYPEILKNIKSTYEDKAYEKTLQHIAAARACAPENEAEIEEWNSKVFQEIQEQRKNAEEAKKKAETAERAALKALLERDKANTEITQLLLERLNEDILYLDYDNASKTIQKAESLSMLPDSLSDIFLEVAFWYGETGQFKQASAILTITARIMGHKEIIGSLQQEPDANPPKQRDLLRRVIKLLDSRQYEALMDIYYPDMVDIKGGTFDMGERRNTHQATVSDFRLGRTEVTYWQYGLFCAATGRNYIQPEWGIEGNHPVIVRNWFDAVEYCIWVNQQWGLEPAITQNGVYDYSLHLKANGFRLPTDAEWEYAARGGAHQSSYIYAGSDDPEEVGWYIDNAGGSPHPVGEKTANELGLYDMSGNVWEWCWDWYEPSFPSNSPVDYTGPEITRAGHVLRGGAWYSGEHQANVFSRVSLDREADKAMYFNHGFRVARSAGKEE